MLEKGYKQNKTADTIGWSNDYVSKHKLLCEKISTEFLAIAEQHQEGRVDKKSTSVEFIFSEGWFRTVDIYIFLALLNKIVPEVLELTKEHQDDHGTEKVPSGTYNFTEGWLY